MRGQSNRKRSFAVVWFAKIGFLPAKKLGFRFVPRFEISFVLAFTALNKGDFSLYIFRIYNFLGELRSQDFISFVVVSYCNKKI